MNRFAKPVRLFILGCVFGTMPCSACLSQAQQKEAAYDKVVSIEGITEYRFKNGLRFLSYPDPASPTITVNMTVLVGSRHEGYGETGMAHLLEHMLFKGSKLYPSSKTLDQAMQSHGVSDYNASTWTDRTNYHETMPASDKNMEFGLKMEADRLVNSFVRREDLAKEMTVVRNEFEIGENKAEMILNQRMMAIAYEWHNYGKSTIGNRADIERVPIERLQAFYRKYYQVDNIVLIVAGKFDPAKALDMVSRYFGTLKAPERTLEQTYTEEPAQDGERSVVLRRVGKVAVVGLMYHVPNAAHEDFPPVEILSMILGETPSGRLYKDLVETKKATSVDYDATGWFDPGIVELTAHVNDGTAPEAIRDAMIAQAEKFNDRPATKDEVTRAVRKYLSEREQRLTKSTSTAIELSEWVAAGDWRLMFINRDRVSKVTPKDVDRVAAKYFKQSNRTSGMFLPSNEVARTPIPERPDVEKLVKEFKGGKSVTEGEAFDATPKNIEKRVKRFRLSSGIQVAYFTKKTRGETVIGNLKLHFGNEKSLLHQNAAASFLGSMLMRGTQKHTRQEIQDQLDSLKSQLHVTSGLGALNVSWETKRDKNLDLLKLVQEILREPTFPESELEILKRSQKQTLEKSMVDPQGLTFRTLLRKLNPFPRESIHYVPTFDESFERLAKVKRDDILKIYTEQVGGTVGEIALVGDFDPEEATKQLETIFAGWKSAVPYVRVPDALIETVKGSRESLVTPDKQNAVYAAAFKFPMSDVDPDYPALEIGNYILGNGFSSRLVIHLRDKEGLCYGTGSQLGVDSLDKVSQFLIYAFCNPANIDQVDKGAIQELNTLVKKGIDQDELKNVRKAYLDEMMVARGKDESLAQMLRSSMFLGRTFAFQAELEKKIAALTVEDVNRALAARLHSDRLVIVRAGDFKKK